MPSCHYGTTFKKGPNKTDSTLSDKKGPAVASQPPLVFLNERSWVIETPVKKPDYPTLAYAGPLLKSA